MVKKYAPLYCTVQKVQYIINRLRGTVTYNIPHHQANHHCCNWSGLRARDFPWESARKFSRGLEPQSVVNIIWISVPMLSLVLLLLSFPGCNNLSFVVCLQLSSFLLSWRPPSSNFSDADFLPACRAQNSRIFILFSATNTFFPPRTSEEGPGPPFDGDLEVQQPDAPRCSICLFLFF